MYDYLRKRAHALADWLRVALLGAIPVAGDTVASAAELSAARWRLVLSVAIPFWAYVTLARTVMFGLLFATNPRTHHCAAVGARRATSAALSAC